MSIVKADVAIFISPSSCKRNLNVTEFELCK